MKRRIFGFHRRVWWPKCMPASSNCRVVTTATAGPAIGCPSPALRPRRGDRWTRPGASKWLMTCPARRAGTGPWYRTAQRPVTWDRRSDAPSAGAASADAVSAGGGDARARSAPPTGRAAPALRVGPVRGAVVQPSPQLQDRLRVDLAHPALGHAEDLADLRQRETLVVIQREHRPLALTELHDGLGEDLLGLLVLEQRHGAGGGIGDRVAERGAVR